MTFGAHSVHRGRRLSQISDVPVVSSDNDSAGAGPFSLFDIVDVVETLPGVSDLELFSQVIVADASGVYHGFWREDILDRSTP